MVLQWCFSSLLPSCSYSGPVNRLFLQGVNRQIQWTSHPVSEISAGSPFSPLESWKEKCSRQFKRCFKMTWTQSLNSFKYTPISCPITWTPYLFGSLHSIWPLSSELHALFFYSPSPVWVTEQVIAQTPKGEGIHNYVETGYKLALSPATLQYSVHRGAPT